MLERFLDAGRLLSQALKAPLDIVGFRIVRGPLFGEFIAKVTRDDSLTRRRLPDEWKAARRGCNTLDDVANFFAIFAGFAGRSDEENDNKEDSQDRNDIEEACFPPSVFEWQPNPLILPLLREEHLQSLKFGPSVAKDTSDCHLMNTSGAAGIFCPDTAVDFDDKGIPKSNQKSPGAPRHTGPATMSANLSSFACPQCTYVANRKFKLKYAINFFLKSACAK